MAENDCIICAYELDGKGGAKPIDYDGVQEAAQSTSTLTWVHLDINLSSAEDWLRKNVPYLDDFIIDALLAEETRPRVEEFGSGILVNLRGVNLNENAKPEDMVSIRLWVDEFRVISLRRRKLKAITDIRQALENGRGPLTSGNFLTELCNRLFNRMEPIISELSDEADDMEESILEQPTVEKRKDIIELRRQSIMIRRYMMPQRDVIGRLKLLEFSWLDNTDKRHLLENHDRVARYIEDLDLVRERTQIIQDELTNTLADRLNKNMYLLSVVAAIFLPLGFLTGLFGINVGGIPMAESANGFFIFSAALGVIVLGMIVWFKKGNWFT